MSYIVPSCSAYRYLGGIFVFALAALALSPTLAQAQATGVTIAQKSSTTFYADYATKSRLRGAYTAFQVTPTGGNVTDMWVKLQNFSGPQVRLATGEDGLVHIGPVTANSAKTAFFYLFAAAETPSSETYQIAVYDGHPSSGGTLIGTTGNPQ